MKVKLHDTIMMAIISGTFLQCFLFHYSIWALLVYPLFFLRYRDNSKIVCMALKIPHQVCFKYKMYRLVIGAKLITVINCHDTSAISNCLYDRVDLLTFH